MNHFFFRRPSKIAVVRISRWTLLTVAIGAWCVATASCLSALVEHSYRPTAVAPAVDSWPAGVSFPQGAGFHVVLFAHPLCPCTHASLVEFNQLLRRVPHGTSATIVFVTGDLPLREYEHTPHVEFARRMTAASIIFDGAREAARFGATVSGECLVFSPDGQRIFRGGLTESRGHVGESSCRAALEALLGGAHDLSFEAPVFGCRLPQVKGE